MPSLGRKLLFSLVPAGLLLAGGLAAGEYWARTQRFTLDPSALLTAPTHTNDRVSGEPCYEPHLTRGYSPVPGRCGRNDLGFYVYGAEQGIPQDPRHVVVIGDSIADQQVWVREAATLAQSKQPDLITFNGGVPGTDSCTQLRILEESGLQLDPDVVLLQFCLNDYAVSATVLPLDDGRRVRIHADGVYEYPAWVLESRLLTIALLNGQVGQVNIGGATRHVASRAEDCIARIDDLADQHGFDFRVVVYPGLVSDATGSDLSIPLDGGDVTPQEAEQRILDFLGSRDIPTLPLRPVLAARGRLEDQRAAPDDPWHPDEATQLAIGAAVGPFILEGLE